VTRMGENALCSLQKTENEGLDCKRSDRHLSGLYWGQLSHHKSLSCGLKPVLRDQTAGAPLREGLLLKHREGETLSKNLEQLGFKGDFKMCDIGGVGGAIVNGLIPGRDPLGGLVKNLIGGGNSQKSNSNSQNTGGAGLSADPMANAEAAAAAEKERRWRLNAKGRSSTLVTGGAGDSSTAKTKHTSLLGG